MKGYWDNLRPSEKRLVVAVMVVFFLVLNFVFVIPHFSDWGRIQFRKEKAEKKLADFQAEIRMLTTYSNQVKQLETEGGSSVPLEEQAHDFSSAILAQAAQSKIVIIGNSRVTENTNNPFFLEQNQNITAQGTEQALLTFLYNLGSGTSPIRVHGLRVDPEMPARMQLRAGITLVASYQKKRPAPGAAGKSATATAKRP